MSMLDSFFNKGFKGSKCKTLLKLTIPRIKLLRNRREIQIKQMRRDIAKLLETGQEATARIRVEHIIREENMMAAQEIIELYCELISVRLPIIETQSLGQISSPIHWTLLDPQLVGHSRSLEPAVAGSLNECPLDLKEAISSLCFAAPRCADLPELLQVQMLMASKYGKEFVAAATELMPDCGVCRQLIELLSVRAPSPDVKLKLLKEIAEEHGLDWDPAASETEFFKPHEDLLNGPTQFVSGSKLPLPKEKHDESLHSASEQTPKEEDSDSDAGFFDPLDFPEVPKATLQPRVDAVSPPAMFPPSPSAPHHQVNYEALRHSEVNENLLRQPHPQPQEAAEERTVADRNESPDVSVKAMEDKQFVPFISRPILASASFSARQNNPPPPPNLSRTKTEADIDLQDVLAAAQVAAESAERAAAAARSAASLAQPHVDHHNSLGDSDGVSNPLDAHQDPENYQASEALNLPSYDRDKVGIDSSPSDDHVIEDKPAHHQPQRLPSMDDDSYFSYPNLFTSQGSNLGSGVHSFTDTSRSTHEH
ncbi:IST1-like protein [Vitis vinifera]|uniref:IST1-like protein n=1 Tax=Vitis vinifera TaxID=29760 RepID=A0A438H0Z1_VITVI|nr:IST1-like protein [Vitis vinifera]